ncbi:LysE/ArgO family amino acid transporter [Paenibacillus allorhizosphaerae]|nr:LysE/ArgO family amino acid transporter [Paenibacillus allorhizosphaerae]
MLAAMIHGIILALGLILPLGVQNVFIFNQGTMHKRFRNVFPAVITASLCDTLLIVSAVFGVSMIVLNIQGVKTGLLCVGVLFLIYMGWVTWRSKPAATADQHNKLHLKQQVAFAATVSLLNPHAILDTVGVIGTSSLRYEGGEKAAFAAAAIVVSWLWFTGLATAGRLTNRVDQSGRMIVALNKISALLMWGTAVYLGISLLQTGS